MIQTVFQILPLTFAVYFISLTKSQEQAGNCADFKMQRYTKGYQQPPTLNLTVVDIQQSTIICYSSAEIIKP